MDINRLFCDIVLYCSYNCIDNIIVVSVVLPSGMGIPAQGMSAVQMQRAPQYKINPAMRNPQQPAVAGQPVPAPVGVCRRICCHCVSV